MGYASADIAERFQWTFPIVLAPTDPRHHLRRLAARLEVDQRGPELDEDQPRSHAPRSEDDGRVGRADHEGQHRRRNLRDGVHASRRRRRTRNVIWAGSDDGYVQVTRNGGTNWKNVTPKALGDFARISLIEASPFRAGTAYVAANRYQQDDFKPYVFRTDDYGETWTAITNGVGAERLRARDSRGHQARRSCCISAPSTASTSRSTTARTGSRCGRTCPTRRCTTSRSRSATSSSPRTAAAST